MKDIIEIDELINNLKKLPSVTSKQAEKIVQHLLNTNEEEVDDLILSIKNLRKNITYCEKCNNISFSPICDICSNDSRDKTILCIVSSPEDLEKIENTNTYVGQYFVLHEECNAKTKQSLNRNTTQKLIKLINKNDFKEVILATNWTSNGELTAAFLRNMIKQLSPKINIYRLAVGLPINSALSYADNETLSQSLKNKTKY